LVTEKEYHYVAAPKVDRKSTVGAGDSMVAGIAFALSRSLHFKQALQYGVACGTAATMNAGTGLCHLHDVEDLYNQMNSATAMNEMLV